MPQNTTILLIRHAEKPNRGAGLAVAGQERAQAYSVFFQNYIYNKKILNLNYLFASDDDVKSHRPKLTITPLSKSIGLAIDEKYKDKDFKKLVDELNKDGHYNNSHILICWHHGEILKLAEALGVDASKLPKTATWPAKWHGDVFGWVLQLVFDAKGKIVTKQTFCRSEKLMYDDYGQVPPGKKK